MTLPWETAEQPPAPPLLCIGCDYDLRTIPASARCPECGLAVDESIRAIGGWSKPRLVALRWTIGAYPIGVLSWASFVVLLAATSHTTLTGRVAATLLAAHAVAISFAAFVGTYAASRQRRAVRFRISLGLSLVLFAAGFIVILAALQLVDKSGFNTQLAYAIAALGRVLIAAFAAWWLIGAMRSLIPVRTRLIGLARVSFWFVVALWSVSFVGFAAAAIFSSNAVLIVGNSLPIVAACVDPIGSALIALAALAMLPEIGWRVVATSHH